MTDPQTIASIRHSLTHPSRDLRRESIDALATLGDLPGLRAALASSDRYLRARAVTALAPMPGEWITWRLARLAFDPEAEVRLAVARTLARRGGWLAGWVLRHLTADPHAVVRYTALAGLVRLDPRCATARLRLVCETDTEPWLQDAARAMLRQCVSTKAPNARDETIACPDQRTAAEGARR